eukprot:TRINITY_DN2739_c0_g2_i2.p1 TRINITY_DN2739_c0_g2~~TRINITY_DN2739_c0_g2_i2.p1  ORF type:complete len:128 (+),score=35.91 TRINITY_DN2739_c0_g2_i2:197-580(+)
MKKCPLFFGSPRGSPKCAPSVWLYVMIGGVGAFLLITAVVAWIVLGTRKIWRGKGKEGKGDVDIMGAGEVARGRSVGSGGSGLYRSAENTREGSGPLSPALNIDSPQAKLSSGIPAPLPGTPVYSGL